MARRRLRAQMSVPLVTDHAPYKVSLETPCFNLDKASCSIVPTPHYLLFANIIVLVALKRPTRALCWSLTRSNLMKQRRAYVAIHDRDAKYCVDGSNLTT